jgi:hypothetical protein
LNVQLKDETVWLTQSQITSLFERERSVITKHINNIFKESELKRESVCAKFAHTAKDGKVYHTQFYNLDVIISVGYRVKSQQGVRFRQWATQTLKQHLVKRYSLNQNRLQSFGMDVGDLMNLVRKTLLNYELAKHLIFCDGIIYQLIASAIFFQKIGFNEIFKTNQ